MAVNIGESNACILIPISVYFQAFHKEIPIGKMMGLISEYCVALWL